MRSKAIVASFISLAILLTFISSTWLTENLKWHHKLLPIKSLSRYSELTSRDLISTTGAPTFGLAFLSTIQMWNITLPMTTARNLAHYNQTAPLSIDTKHTWLSEYDKLTRGVPLAEMFACPETIGSQRQCQYYQPDWWGRLDTGQLLKDRIVEVRKRCQRFYSDMFNSSLSKFGRSHSDKNLLKRKRVIKSQKLKLSFCWMPKMGSTFWKKAWTPLTKAARGSGRPGAKYQQVTAYFSCHKPGYTAYSIARSPWDRLVSVYREKCEKNFGKKCKLKFGNRCHVCPTFEKFVRCILSSMKREWTEHYGHVDTTYNRCGVCDFPYQYIVLMENMMNETSYIMKLHGVGQPQAVMEAVRRKTIRPVEKRNRDLSYTDYWKRIPNNLIDRVRFYFRYELYLYSYPETPFYVEPPT